MLLPDFTTLLIIFPISRAVTALFDVREDNF